MKTTEETRSCCPSFACMRADGVTCPDDECDYENGIYEGPANRWWLFDESLQERPAAEEKQP